MAVSTWAMCASSAYAGDGEAHPHEPARTPWNYADSQRMPGATRRIARVSNTIHGCLVTQTF
jgi:hypothetical protein